MAKPIQYARGEKHKRVAAADLYRVYQIFFANQTFEEDVKIANLSTFKRILVLNSFVVRRVKSRRGEVQGIKLSTGHVKEIFRKAGKEGEYED